MSGQQRAWVEQRPADGGVTVRLGGELDIAGAAEVAPAVDELLASGPPVAAVDLGDVRFMDSSGVALLIRLVNHAAPAAVVHPTPAVRRTLQALGLTSRLPMAPGPADVKRWFPREAASVPASRQHLIVVVPDLPAEASETACLLVSELATNAVVHGGGDGYLLDIRFDPGSGCLTVSVTDAGDGLPRVLDPGAGDEHGRGLQLVAVLADDWGVRPAGPAGAKTVWFEHRVPVANPPAGSGPGAGTPRTASDA